MQKKALCRCTRVFEHGRISIVRETVRNRTPSQQNKLSKKESVPLRLSWCKAPRRPKPPGRPRVAIGEAWSNPQLAAMQPSGLWILAQALGMPQCSHQQFVALREPLPAFGPFVHISVAGREVVECSPRVDNVSNADPRVACRDGRHIRAGAAQD